MAIVRARYPGKEHDKLTPLGSAKTTKPVPNEVVIEIGKPIEPSPSWTCGTDLVWPVVRIIEPAGVEFVSIHPYVCRHSLDAGD